jgi:DUF2959 family protein
MSVRTWLIAGVAIVAVSCASSGVSRTDSLMKSLDNLVSTSATARTDIDKVTGTLKSFAEGGGADPRALFNQYSAEVGKVAGSRAAMSSAGSSVRQAMDAHFAAWEKDANAMQNPEIREASMKRRDEARSKMGAVEPALAKAGSAFDAYVANLKDIEKLLATDLSPGGISAASGLIQKASDEAGGVQSSLQAIESTANELISALSVPTAPKTPPAEAPPAK